jgi:carbon-monoxide dehydrogenase iron sulfur subunit
MEKNINILCRIEKCLGCRSCEIACGIEHSKSKDLLQCLLELPLPRQRRSVESLPGINVSNACRHCEPAPCVSACMSGSMYKEKNGATLHDKDRCVGCWMCVMVCPFGAISRQERLALKCDLCPDREDEYACVEACPTGALCIT